MGFRRSLVQIQSPRHDEGAEVTTSYDGPSSFSLRRKTRLVRFAVRKPRPGLTSPDGLPCLKKEPREGWRTPIRHGLSLGGCISAEGFLLLEVVSAMRCSNSWMRA